MTLSTTDKKLSIGSFKGKIIRKQISPIRRIDKDDNRDSISILLNSKVGINRELGIFTDTKKRPVFEAYEKDDETYIKFIGNSDIPADSSDIPIISPYHPKKRKTSSKSKVSSKSKTSSTTSAKDKNLFKLVSNGIEFNVGLIYEKDKSKKSDDDIKYPKIFDNILLTKEDLSNYGTINKEMFTFSIYDNNGIPSLRCNSPSCMNKSNIINNIENIFMEPINKKEKKIELNDLSKNIIKLISEIKNLEIITTDNINELMALAIQLHSNSILNLTKSLKSTFGNRNLVELELAELSDSIKIFRRIGKFDFLEIPNLTDEEKSKHSKFINLLLTESSLTKKLENLDNEFDSILDKISNSIYISRHSIINNSKSTSKSIAELMLDETKLSKDDKMDALKTELTILYKLKKLEESIENNYLNMHKLISEIFLSSNLQNFMEYNIKDVNGISSKSKQKRIINKILKHAKIDKTLSNDEIKGFIKTANKINRYIKNKFTDDKQKIKSLYVSIDYNTDKKNVNRSLIDALRILKIFTFRELYSLVIDNPMSINDKFMNNVIKDINTTNEMITISDIKQSSINEKISIFHAGMMLLDAIGNEMNRNISMYATISTNLIAWSSEDNTKTYASNRNYDSKTKYDFRESMNIPDYMKDKIKKQILLAKSLNDQ